MSSTENPTIQAIFPEATADDLWEYIAGDGDDAEGGEFDNGRETWTHRYTLIRGTWIYTRSTCAGDDILYTHQVCADRAEARQAYRDAIVAACADWTEADGPVWMDCGYDGDSVVQLGEAGLIPTGTYTD
jgi:hypothetical protein